MGDGYFVTTLKHSIMALSKIKNHTFQRMGGRYTKYFDADHFMGRSSMDDFEITKPKKKLKMETDASDIQMALPGFYKNEIKVTLSNNTLFVIAKRDSFKNFKDRFLQMEFHTNQQQRQFSLAKQVDQQSISCDFSNGILHINLPLEKEANQGAFNRRISVL
ncbi:MAG: HSP20 family protein [Bacteroidia bacterium]